MIVLVIPVNMVQRVLMVLLHTHVNVRKVLLENIVKSVGLFHTDKRMKN